jgi:hypothetical protein
MAGSSITVERCLRFELDEIISVVRMPQVIARLMAVSSWWPVALTIPVRAGKDLKAALVDAKAAQGRGDVEEALRIYNGSTSAC